MGFIGSMLGGTLKAGLGVSKLGWAGLSRGPIGGAAVGAVAGGIIGGVTSNSNTMNNRISDAMSGAVKGGLMGAGIGGALRAPGYIASAYRMGANKGAYAVGKRFAGIGARAGRFAMEHPKTMLALGGGALAASAIQTSAAGQPLISPTMSGKKVDTKYNKQALGSAALRSEFIMGPEIGTAPEMAANMQYASMMDEFQDAGMGVASFGAGVVDSRSQQLTGSTLGLVQGLNNGRHG